MRQTNYGYTIPAGVPGGLFDLSDKKIETRILDDGMVTAPGLGLVKGSRPGETVANPTSAATADTFEGVFVNGSKNLENDQNGVVAAIGANALGLMQHGKIWVQVVDTVTTTYKKKVALITDGDNAGMFTDEDDTAEATKITIEAQFTGKADKASGIAAIELK
ncbi:MAG: structural cement protein Gp24 [Lachnospiraceae bacterium]